MTTDVKVPIEIVYYHYQANAYFSLSWSGPGISSLTPVGGNNLFYGREIMNSPVTVEIYPGFWDDTTSSATGAGLNDCVSMSTCEFTIHARDTYGNRIFNWGGDNFNVTIRGINDWAGYDRDHSRRNDINISSVAHVPQPVVVPLGWKLLGQGSINFGDTVMKTFSDFRNLVARGDTVRVVTQTMMVDIDESQEFTNASIPLARPFLGDNTANVSVYKIENCTAGTYKVTYWPEIRGMYDLSIEIPATPEVQMVEFFAEGGLGGNFTMRMSANVDNRLMSNTTEAIDIQTTTESSIETYLENLMIITDGITIQIINQTEFNFRFLVTFAGMNADLPLLELDTINTYGNNFGTKVSQIQAGTPHRGIIDSPFKLTVAPNVTDAGFSTAFGQGLFYGVTGEVSKFTIQTKDRWGNNRLHNQSREIFKVHAFIPDRSYDAISTAVEGTIVYDNSAAGGTYDVEFTPVIQGEYVVNIMLAEQLEVQNLTTKFSNMGDRKGYFTLSYGKCGLTNPCPRTKRLAWDSDANDVKLALEELAGVGKLNVEYTQTTDLKDAAWAITFLTACDMEEIAIYEQTMPANTIAIDTVHEGTCSYISTEQPGVSYPQHFVNTDNILHEVQNVTIDCLNGDNAPDCDFY
jgi:hypothetical protein